MRRYSELKLLPTYAERLDYLQLQGSIGIETFGFDRYLNQRFYRSYEWKAARDIVIIRDNGCDLAIENLPIFGRLIVHHMNPISIDDVLSHSDLLFNPEYLICVSIDTHNKIHYGSCQEGTLPIERTPFDTCPWKKGALDHG